MADKRLGPTDNRSRPRRLTMRPLLIIQTGTTFPDLAVQIGDFTDWTRQGLKLTVQQAPVINVRAGQPLPAPSSLSGALLTGSHDMVTTQADWMQDSANWLRHAVQARLPVLGICFGHQLLAQALGGAVDWNPHGREIGTTTVTLTPEGRRDPLFGQLPPSFPAQVSHSQTVLQLPPQACLLASSPGDPHQAFRLGSALGVQFHPEFPVQALSFYLTILTNELRAEGLDPERLRAGLQETPQSASLLGLFARSRRPG